MEKNIYIENGYESRKDYLDCMAEEYGSAIYSIADLLGPSEDFDGLVSMAEDMLEDF